MVLKIRNLSSKKTARIFYHYTDFLVEIKPLQTITLPSDISFHLIHPIVAGFKHLKLYDSLVEDSDNDGVIDWANSVGLTSQGTVVDADTILNEFGNVYEAITNIEQGGIIDVDGGSF